MRHSSAFTGLLLLIVAAAVGQAGLASLDKNISSTICAGNLRELVAATEQYAADHNDRLPAAVDRTKKPWRWWYFELFPYVGSMRAFYCPEKAPEFYDEKNMSPLLPVVWDYRFLSYGYNHEIDLLQRKEEAPELKTFNNPPRVLFAESNDYLASPGKSSWDQQIAARHGGKAHFALSDGSVVLESPGSAPSPSGTGIHQLNTWRFR